MLKALGDGHTLSYTTPGAALAAGQRIVQCTRRDHPLGVHASVRRGTCILRGGDYFGGTVNLAARLLDVAGRDELVASKTIVDATDDDFRWRALGTRTICGVDGPVEVFRLV